MNKLTFLVALVVSGIAFAQNHTQIKGRAIDQYVYEIRDPQTDSVHFRQALEKIGEYLALCIADELSTEEATVRTLTDADAKHHLISETPVLVTILRAGLPLNAGVHKVFPKAKVGFIAMARNEETLKASMDYIALPDLRGQSVILTDTMLATGGSLLNAIQIIEKQHPKQIFVIAAIAAKPGIERLRKYNPNIKIVAAAIDPTLNEKGYIVPGLGDAGDRSYGDKYGVAN